MTQASSSKPTSAANRSLKRKSASRLAAVMALYRQYFRDVTLDTPAVLAEAVLMHADHAYNEELGLGEAPEKALLTTILENALSARDEIDRMIEAALGEKWQKDRLGPLLESILHAAVAELMSKPERNHKIIINEYVSLANEYYDDPELGFVNGILATIAGRLRTA